MDKPCTYVLDKEESRDFEELYALAQLDRLRREYPHKEFARLPLPKSLAPRRRKIEDEFRPTFSFVQVNNKSKALPDCSALLQYVFCKQSSDLTAL
ncbi:MAG: hypothetical protein P4M11_11610 [Candidatus Pacebacteria bacterium]|nr:hypothetical protein [Candidatus Paceibacterota bacterium]